MSELIKGNFKVRANVSAEPVVLNPQDAYRKKAIESIGGSMVFVERGKLFWDGKA